MSNYTKETLSPILEALLFASEEPLSTRKIISLLTGDDDRLTIETNIEDSSQDVSLDEVMSQEVSLGSKKKGLDNDLIRDVINSLNFVFNETNRIFRIVEVAGGFQFATLQEYGKYVALLSKDKIKRRLSPAALETLSIVAYKQPISKSEVEIIRGVNSDQVIVSLMERNLLAISGRSESVGRALLYSTTDDFLRTFGLKSVNDLPKLREIDELMEEGAFAPMKPEIVIVSQEANAENIEEAVAHSKS